MAKFVLIPESQGDLFFQKVTAVYGPNDCIKISENLILIHSTTELTADQVVSRIDVENGMLLKDLNVRYVLFSVTSYQGWHTNSMWSWLNSKGI